MSGISWAAVAAPGPSFRRSSSVISHRLRDAVRANEAEVDVHQQNDQRRQEKHVCREEDLEGGRADHWATLKNRFDESAYKGRRRQPRDLDGYLGGEVRLGVPWQQVARQRENED